MSQDMAEPENIKTAAHRREKKPPKKITEKYLYNSGLAYLQRFPASTAHFRRVMGRKIDRSCNYHKNQEREDCQKMLDSTVETFVRQGLLNDAAYLQGMVTSLRRRGLSTQAILSKLAMKGMDQDSAAKALRAYDEDRGGGADPDLAAAIALMRRKRIGAFRTSEGESDRMKDMAAFARAGFSFDIARKALSLPRDEAEEILSQIRA